MRSVVVAFLLTVWGLLPNTAQQIPQEHKPNEHYAQAQPSVQETKPATEQRTSEKENGGSDAAWLWKFCDRWGNAINAISTLVIAIFTVVLWWSTHKLWKSGEKHSERELRAYVFPVDFQVRNFKTALRTLDPAQKISAFVRIKNTGQTPAHKFTCQVKMTVGPFPQTDFTISEEEAEFTPAYLGPGAQVTCSPVKDTLLPMQHAKAVAEGSWAIYVFGRIDYVDAFKVPRWIIFRTLARGDHGAMSGVGEEKDVLLLQTDKDGNKTDC